ncbi:uncharacterized protein MELLADRAFT_64546 [Melampsora larici-populina 98AG31]|uniref:Uncharacterized protein n=1 Tax=Melampsora larici-populina (strain 98AG31 / pathotype 3-4-7) TaxID=747676 RepID=F4RRU7_MELLP|nr:uncharacterized protein MELLADRAFT_64546 [Melampsora larici-populina 98AG31]EGG04891.1 hypothetical protein MELLADRAFT_64546 [Melampsora larici-populina 98AG31]
MGWPADDDQPVEEQRAEWKYDVVQPLTLRLAPSGNQAFQCHLSVSGNSAPIKEDTTIESNEVPIKVEPDDDEVVMESNAVSVKVEPEANEEVMQPEINALCQS